MLKNYSSLNLALLLFALFSGLHQANAQWQPTTGLNGGQVNAFTAKGTKYYAATDTGGIFISGDNGLNWAPSNAGLDNHNTGSLVVKNNVIVAGIRNGMVNGAIAISNDDGATWTAATSPYYGYLFCLLLKGSDIYAGTWFGVTKSTDNGNSMTTLANNGLPSNASVLALAATDNTMFAAVGYSSTNDQGVYASTDNGVNWTEKNTGLTNGNVTSLATAGSKVFVGTSGGVFVSSDNGNNWTAANSGLTSANIHSLYAFGSAVFAGTDDGIFLTTNGGSSWSSAGTGIPASSKIYSINMVGNYLMAGGSTGAWRRSMAEMVSGIDRAEEAGIKLYPNPGNGKFTLQLPDGGNAEVSVSNMLGCEVYHSMVENGAEANLGIQPAGVYLVRVQSGGHSYLSKLYIAQ